VYVHLLWTRRERAFKSVDTDVVIHKDDVGESKAKKAIVRTLRVSAAKAGKPTKWSAPYDSLMSSAPSHCLHWRTWALLHTHELPPFACMPPFAMHRHFEVGIPVL
jgi:hypothetical protein